MGRQILGLIVYPIKTKINCHKNVYRIPKIAVVIVLGLGQGYQSITFRLDDGIFKIRFFEEWIVLMNL